MNEFNPLDSILFITLPKELNLSAHQMELDYSIPLPVQKRQPGAWILDPFTGSSTTGIAANLLGRRFLGIDKEEMYLEISRKRKLEIEDIRTFSSYRKKVKDIALLDKKSSTLFALEEEFLGYDLPF